MVDPQTLKAFVAHYQIHLAIGAIVIGSIIYYSLYRYWQKNPPPPDDDRPTHNQVAIFLIVVTIAAISYGLYEDYAQRKYYLEFQEQYYFVLPDNVTCENGQRNPTTPIGSELYLFSNCTDSQERILHKPWLLNGFRMYDAWNNNTEVLP